MIYYPDDTLRKVSETVSELNTSVLELVKIMKNQMIEHNGIGISAVQVGSPLRCLIAKDTIMFNPYVLELSDDQEKLEEGCLSIPGVTAKVKRSVYMSLVYTDVNNESVFLEAEGFFARVIQHEIDHLDGILYIDRLTGVIRSFRLKNYEKPS